jgi:hypothetical protein
MNIEMNELHGIGIHDTLWGSTTMAMNSWERVVCYRVLLKSVATLFGDT